MPTAAYKVGGVRVPGTTTVISRFKDSGGLMFWACEQGQKNPGMSPRDALYGEDAHATKAANIGTIAHAMVEAHINGETPTTDDEKARNAYEQFVEWAQQTGIEFLTKYQEISLVCPQYLYGGTPDAIGKLGNKLVVLDWKSSNKVYPDYVLQLAAYGHLIEHGVRLDTGEPLSLGPVQDYHLLRFSKDYPDFEHRRFGDVSMEWEQFKAFRECYERDRQIKARVK